MFEKRNLKLDVFALMFLAVSIFMMVSLVTFNPADPPSTLVYPAEEKVTNACGVLGAIAARWSFEMLGIGAYYLAISVFVLDILLLMRRNISEPFLRGIGWVVSLVGITTLAALVLPSLSPGPVIGSGGYLGATGRGLLEMNFASTGAYILVAAVIIGGLLLCTDYFLIKASLWLFGVPATGLMRVAGVKRNAEKAKPTVKQEDELAEGEEEDEEEEYEEEEAEYEEEDESEEEEEESEIEIKISGQSTKDEEEDEEDKSEPIIKRKARKVKKRLASALRINKPKSKNKDEEDVREQLNAAAMREDAIDYELPSVDLLKNSEHVPIELHESSIRRTAKLLEQSFENFGFKVRVVEIQTGPVIAQYEIELERGLRLSKITGLADDVAIALRVPSVRIVAPIPGKNTVGIEVPNAERQLVCMRDILEESASKVRNQKIPIFLGKDVTGNPMVMDLASLPHLLIAGRTGTGKSVCLNSIIISMLMTRRPDEVKMLMIDPKMVELSPYQRLPHLMHPVVTDMRKAEAILAWAVEKMEERYSLLARAGVRHLSVYNQLGEEELMDRFQPETDEERNSIPLNMPYIVIIADEIADLMMTAGKDVETHIIRLAQKSRAVGIHLILATQKPTVDVITGLIKSNLPARLSFQVASRTDSRVVLDEMGADKLLGNGDMLFLWPGTSTLMRGQGTYVSDDEITDVVTVAAKTEQNFASELVQLKTKEELEEETPGKLKKRDELYESAVDVIVHEGRGSVSLLQRNLGIGYGRAARLIDFMSEDGIVGPYNGSQAREVLLTVEQWKEMNGESPDDPDPKPPSPSPKNVTKLEDNEEEEDDEDEYEYEEDEYEEEEVAEGEEDDEYEYEEEDDELEDEEEYEEEEEEIHAEAEDAPWEEEEEDEVDEYEDEEYEDDEYEEEEYEEDEYEEDEYEEEEEDEDPKPRRAKSA